jgi:hypothetical protein
VVAGVDKFREHFAGHEDQYALIGGAACDLLFGDAGLPFRATKDLDVVLCVEVVSAEFATAFLDFLNAGGYQARQKSDGRKEFFRFHKPSNPDYPFMIELFAREPGGFALPDDRTLVKIPVEEDVLSLSAILLDANYYEALQSSRIVIDGISILSEELLIPFKAKAFLDLRQRQSEGESLSDKQINKHRNDVFRLAQLLPADHHLDVTDGIRDDLRVFLNTIAEDDRFDPTTFGVQFSKSEGITLLDNVYGLSA